MERNPTPLPLDPHAVPPRGDPKTGDVFLRYQGHLGTTCACPARSKPARSKPARSGQRGIYLGLAKHDWRRHIGRCGGNAPSNNGAAQHYEGDKSNFVLVPETYAFPKCTCQPGRCVDG